MWDRDHFHYKYAIQHMLKCDVKFYETKTLPFFKKMVGSLKFLCISHTVVPVVTALEVTIYTKVSNVPASVP